MKLEGYLVFGFYFLICIFYLSKSDYIVQQSGFRAKKKIVSTLTLWLFLLGALRSYYTGIDTYNYARRFEIESIPLDIGEAIRSAIEQGLDGEAGYRLLGAVFGKIIPNTQLWIVFLWLIFVLACRKLILHYSENPSMSYLYIVASLIATFMWQGLRQCVAATICLLAYPSLCKKKYVRFGIYMIAAFMFHRSSLFFLIGATAWYIPIGITSYLIIGIAFLLAAISPYRVINYILSISSAMQMESFSVQINSYIVGVGSRAGTFSYFFVLLFLYSACFFVKDGVIQKDKNSKLLLNLSMMGVAVQAMSVIIPEFFRLSYYFSIYNMLLLPKVCAEYKRKYPGLHVQEL